MRGTRNGHLRRRRNTFTLRLLVLRLLESLQLSTNTRSTSDTPFACNNYGCCPVKDVPRLVWIRTFLGLLIWSEGDLNDDRSLGFSLPESE